MKHYALICTLFLSSTAFAAPRDMCPTDAHRARLTEFQADLAGSADVEEARAKAMSKLKLSHVAIDRAAKMFPNAEGVAAADAKLEALELGILGAESPDAVAAEFGKLDGQAMTCQYDTVEIAIIVIGFLLAVIPGIIFLFLFC